MQSRARSVRNLFLEEYGLREELRLGADEQTLYDWVRKRNIRVDHHALDFDHHRYFTAVYRDTHPEIVVASAAQMGKTIWELLEAPYMKLKYNPVKIGLFFPNRDGVQKLVQDRYDPLVGSIPMIAKIYERQRRMRGRKKLADNTALKQLLSSSLYFLYTGGVVSKDSTPLDILYFDEVRLMHLNEIEQILKRILHSKIGMTRFVSTMGFPGDAIDLLYQRSNQLEFHTDCRCPEGVVLVDHFPDSVGIRTNPKPAREKYFYRCPVCDTEIKDTQKGRWIAHKPENAAHGYHIHGMLRSPDLPTGTARYVWEQYENSQNIKEFYNSVLGVPYIDKSNMVLTPDMLSSCVDTELSWESHGKNCFMGIDNMGGFNYVVIKKLTDEGMRQVVHLEIVYGDDPFRRCAQLMNIYDVRLCCMEQLPNYNEAVQFAKNFPSRVYLVNDYNGREARPISWLDRDVESAQQQKADTGIRFKYLVSLNHYKVYDWTLKLWANRLNRVPNPLRLVQKVRVESLPPVLREKHYRGMALTKPVPAAICKDIYFDHLVRKVRIKRPEVVKDPNTGMDFETGQFKFSYVNLGLDPHFTSADMLCNVATARIKPPRDIEFI